ncbi:hypothetical protein EDB84DRAFT_1052862 [Lactarius hengduanensis]|nr:hypothetical protein EDB84DRAFT_1052862 [Lactarius hengduanensis]
MAEILVKIMAEVISILSIATKEMQQSRSKIYINKLLGRADIDDALKKLDSLTQEEVRMVITQVLPTSSAYRISQKWCAAPLTSNHPSLIFCPARCRGSQQGCARNKGWCGDNNVPWFFLNMFDQKYIL